MNDELNFIQAVTEIKRLGPANMLPTAVKDILSRIKDKSTVQLRTVSDYPLDDDDTVRIVNMTKIREPLPFSFRLGSTYLSSDQSKVYIEDILKRNLLNDDEAYRLRVILAQADYELEKAPNQMMLQTTKGLKLSAQDSKRVLVHDIHPYFYELKLPTVHIKFPVGVNLITGASGTGKSVMVRKIASQLKIPVLSVGEPAIGVKHSRVHIGKAIVEFLNDPVSDGLIIDSMTTFLTAGKDDAAGSGGVSNNFLDDIVELSNLSASKGKTIFVVLNSKTIDTKDMIAFMGRTSGFFLFGRVADSRAGLATGVGEFRFSTRVSIHSRREHGPYSLFDEGKKLDVDIREAKDASLSSIDLANYKPFF